jgi:hypothetical protein
MPSEKIQEALSRLQDDWPLRVLLSALAEGVAELAALLSQAEAQKLPPEFLTRIRAIEEEMHALPASVKTHHYQEWGIEEKSITCPSFKNWLKKEFPRSSSPRAYR